MTRTIINAVIDAAAALLFLGMIATGYVLRFPLPPGTNRLYTLWGLTRHQWGTIHFWISIGLLGVLVAHVVLHWQWVVNVLGKRLRLVKSPRASLAKSGLVAVLGVTAVLVLFATATHRGVREISSAGPVLRAPVDASPSQIVAADSATTRAAQADELWEGVRTLFDRHCVSCHGPQRQRGGFRIDRPDDVLAPDGRTPWVVPGDAANSPLIAIISGGRPAMRMADRHKLPDDDVDLVRAWIEAGAHWPAPAE